MRMIIVQLNELNFDLLNQYAERVNLPNFTKIQKLEKILTTSEEDYESLEPWIQWYSFYTGKRVSDHGVRRLGDCVNQTDRTFFDILENEKHSIGCISAMNLSNNFSNPRYFIPDPWTQTSSDPSLISRLLHISVAQAVNDNAKSKIKFKSILGLLYAFAFYTSFKMKIRLTSLAFKARKKKWFKAIFLDSFLSEIFLSLQKSRSADVSVIFLNSLAHLQHHYMHNCSVLRLEKNPNWLLTNDEDPLLDGIVEMDVILGNIVELAEKSGANILVATGLTQVPYDKKIFYYRLKDHNKFFDNFNICYSKIYPRMTRDFEVIFESNNLRDKATKDLSNIYINDEVAFGIIDKRELSLFITLTYGKEIQTSDRFKLRESEYKATDLVSFVAIKNGHHSGNGWMFHNLPLNKPSTKTINISDISQLIVNNFRQAVSKKS